MSVFFFAPLCHSCTATQFDCSDDESVNAATEYACLQLCASFIGTLAAAALINASSLYINCTNLIEPRPLVERERGTDLDCGASSPSHSLPHAKYLCRRRECVCWTHKHNDDADVDDGNKNEEFCSTISRQANQLRVVFIPSGLTAHTGDKSNKSTRPI